MKVPDDLLLTVLNGELRGRTWPLRRAVAIGSNRDCELHLRDAAVSWNHARLWREDDEFLVEDLGSANGTFLNDRAIERASLTSGDRLRIGSTELSLLPDGADLDRIDGGSASSGSAAGNAKAPVRRSLLERAETAERELAGIHAETAKAREEFAALIEAREQAEAACQDALGEVARLKKERKKASSEMSSFGKKVEQAKEKQGGAEKRAKDLERKLAKLEAAAASGAEERKQLARERDNIERQRETAGLDQEASESRLASVQSELEAARCDVSTRAREQRELVEVHRGEIRELEAKRRTGEKRAFEDEKSREASVTEGDRLRERVEELIEGRKTSARRLEESAAREKDLADRLLERERDIAGREGELAAANATVERLEKDRASLEKAITAERDSTRETTAGMRRQCEELIESRTGDATHFREELQQLAEGNRQQIAEAEDRGRRSLEGRIEELVTRAERLESELTARDERIERFGLERGERESLHAQQAKAREEIGRLDAGRAAADAERDRAREDAKAIAAERDALRAEHAAERDVLRSDVAKLHVELATLREDLGRLEELRKVADIATETAREEVSRQHERQLALERDLDAAHTARDTLAHEVGSLEEARAEITTALEEAHEEIRRLGVSLDEMESRLETAVVCRSELEAKLEAAEIEVENELQRRRDHEIAYHQAEAEADRLVAGIAELRRQVETERGERTRFEAALADASETSMRVEAELRAENVDLRGALDGAEATRLEERSELEALEDARGRESAELVLLRGYVDELRVRILEKEQQIDDLRLRGRDVRVRDVVEPSPPVSDSTFEVSHA